MEKGFVNKMGKLLIAYERERVTEILGNQEGKLSFLQSFPGVVRFNKKDAVFNVSGLFQIPGGSPILILPWFLKGDNRTILQPGSQSKDIGSFFSLIKEIRSFMTNSIGLDTDANALDIIIHSHLLLLSKSVEHMATLNYHEETRETSNVIKGRWHPEKDLRVGAKPTKFTCSFQVLSKDFPVLVFAKAFVRWIDQRVTSKNNKGLIANIDKFLKDVSQEDLDQKMILSAKNWATKRKQFADWIGVISFAENLVLERNAYTEGAGISYQFQMDKFFEDLIRQICIGVPNSSLHLQKRDEVLGGAVWKNEDHLLVDDTGRDARQFSIPDIVIETKSEYFVIECKYKPFKVPLINDFSNSPDLTRFGRNDRNQLLSFLMSVRPSPALSKKRIRFAILFPCRESSLMTGANLVFTSAKLQIDPVVRNVIQNRAGFSEENRLTVKFIGLNVSAAIEQLLKKQDTLQNKFIEILADSSLTVLSQEPATSFEKILERRLSLSSKIVAEGKDDKTLGRVKLAKIFYLADAHLNLNLQAQYYREAMGPYDDRLMRNPKVGIENLAPKNSYYRVLVSKREDGEVEKVRYVPGPNIGTALEKMELIFTGKVEAIERIVHLMLPLNTERSEIVATLYACWNDLIGTRGHTPSSEQIIAEFKTKWHPCKQRFDDTKLQNAIEWMKKNELIPSGTGPKTLTKINVKDAADF